MIFRTLPVSRNVSFILNGLGCYGLIWSRRKVSSNLSAFTLLRRHLSEEEFWTITEEQIWLHSCGPRGRIIDYMPGVSSLGGDNRMLRIFINLYKSKNKCPHSVGIPSFKTDKSMGSRGREKARFQEQIPKYPETFYATHKLNFKIIFSLPLC